MAKITKCAACEGELTQIDVNVHWCKKCGSLLVDMSSKQRGPQVDVIRPQSFRDRIVKKGEQDEC